MSRGLVVERQGNQAQVAHARAWSAPTSRRRRPAPAPATSSAGRKRRPAKTCQRSHGCAPAGEAHDAATAAGPHGAVAGDGQRAQARQRQTRGRIEPHGVWRDAHERGRLEPPPDAARICGRRARPLERAAGSRRGSSPRQRDRASARDARTAGALTGAPEAADHAGDGACPAPRARPSAPRPARTPLAAKPRGVIRCRRA